MRRENRNLRIENLENRNLMAGDVTVELSSSDARDLNIVGDELSNGILVEQVATDRIRVSGTTRHGAPTTINGSNGPVEFRVTDDVRISMLGGGDKVDIDNLDLEQRTHNDLIVDMGADSFDDILMRDVRVSDDIQIDLGSGNDFADLIAVRAGDNLHIDGAGGNDTMLVVSSRAEDIRVFAGSGADELHMHRNVVSDLLYTELGSGNDELLLYSNNSQRVYFDGGSGTDRLHTSSRQANNFWAAAWWNSTSLEAEYSYLPGYRGYSNSIGSNV